MNLLTIDTSIIAALAVRLFNFTNAVLSCQSQALTFPGAVD